MKLKYILIILFIIASIIGVVGIVTENKDGYKYTGPWIKVKDNVTLNTTLPNVPQEVFILKVDKKNIDGNRSFKLAKNVLDIENLNNVGADNSKFILKRDNSNSTITIFKKGQMRYTTGKEFQGIYNKEDLSNINQIKDINKGFIQRLLNEDLINKDMVDITKSEVVNDEICRYNISNGKIECYISNQHINTYLSYNGVRIDGGGGKLRTYFGKNGEMIGLLNSVGKLVPDKKVSVITPLDAINKLKEKGYKDIIIEKMEFVYNVKSPDEDNDYAYPEYKITGVLNNPNGKIGFGLFIPAVK